MLTIKGGYSTRGEQAPSIQYQDGDNTHVFVELDKNAQWLLKGVGGRSVRKGDLKPVTVLQLLRERFDLEMNSEGDPAVAELQMESQSQIECDIELP